MSDSISRQSVIDLLKYWSDGYSYIETPTDGAIKDIESLPFIDAVKHGIWMEENPRPRSSQFYCSVCHRTAYDPQPTRIDGWVKRCRYIYCPNCGARMDERKES